MKHSLLAFFHLNCMILNVLIVQLLPVTTVIVLPLPSSFHECLSMVSDLRSYSTQTPVWML